MYNQCYVSLKNESNCMNMYSLGIDCKFRFRVCDIRHAVFSFSIEKCFIYTEQTTHIN